MPRLIIMTSRQCGKQVNITGRLTSIGRSETNAVVLDNDRVSRTHAVIDWNGDRFTITDLASSNGTYVNAARVQVKALAHGDTIHIGDCQVRFFYDRQTSAPSDMLSLVALPELEPAANPFIALRSESAVPEEFQRS